MVTIDTTNGTIWTAAISGGTPPYSYRWYHGENLWGGGDTLSIPKPRVPGTYSIRVTDSHGCHYTAWITRYPDVTGIVVPPEEKEHENMRAFPNPFSNEIMIKFENDSEKEIQLYDPVGELVFKRMFKGTMLQVDTSDCIPGIYFMIVKEDTHLTAKKFVKME